MNLSNEYIIHQKKDKIEYIQFKKLLPYSEIVHGYTLKVHDFDIGSNDSKINLDSYQVLAEGLGIEKKQIVRPYQLHTDVVKSVSFYQEDIRIFPEELKGVDGLITNKKDIFFCLSYGDCTPLFFYDPIKKVIGNIHSGWKGTLARIGSKAVQKMIEEYDSKPEDIICCIGPHIKSCHFEVGEEVAKTFKDEFNEMEEIEEIIQFTSAQDGEKKYHIDTTKINENLLLAAGLKKENIVDSGICTVCHKEAFHSYRVQKEKAGRNAAIIGKK